MRSSGGGHGGVRRGWQGGRRSPGGARCVPAYKADGIGGLVVGTHVAILLGALSVPCGANVGASGVVAPRPATFDLHLLSVSNVWPFSNDWVRPQFSL